MIGRKPPWLPPSPPSQLGCDIGDAADPCFDASVDNKGDQLVPSEDVKTTATANNKIFFFTIVSGARHACGLVFSGLADEETAWCWGDNTFGQVGVASSPVCDTGISFPCDRAAVQVQGPGGGAPLRFQQIAAGGDFTCAVTQAAQVYCWGRNQFGQLGNGTMVDSDVPVQVIGSFGAGVAALTVGETHACVLSPDGAAYCWGANADGQLGDGTQTPGGQAQAVAVVGGHAFTSIAAGSNHTCGVVSTAGAGFAPADFQGSGPTYCWGSNGAIFPAEFGGKLGTGRDEMGNLLNSLVPVRVAEPEDFFFFF